MLCKLAACEISIFYLVFVAEETGLKLALTEIPKTGFLATRIKIVALICPAAEASSNTRYILQSSLSVCDSI